MGQKNSKGLHEPLLDNPITVSDIYKLNRQDLKQLFSEGDGGLQTALRFLKDHQGSKGILQKLSSDDRTGIVGDEKDLLRRTKHFGANSKPLADPPKLKDSIMQALEEPIWAVLAISALLAGIVEAFAQGWSNIIEPIYIILMTIFLLTVTACADLIKDKRFIDLRSLLLDEKVPVIRGKQGSTNNISAWDLVVGDVIILESGSKVPADCLVLEASELQVTAPDTDDSNQATAPKVKTDQNGNPGTGIVDPVLFAGSKVVKGTGKALICCVGESSSMKKEKPADLDEHTPLQGKLQNLEKQFTLGAICSAIAILVILIIKLSLDTWVFKTADAGDFLTKITNFINIIVVLIVVSIPDGLPITIGISLAFSVKKMYSQKILVRKLDAPEKMGGIQEICCGKTGTLTRNQMKVSQFYSESKLIINNRKDTFDKCELQNETKLRIQESILYNCDARVQMHGSVYKSVGDGTEVGLLNFLQDADIPIHLLINKKHGKILMRSPFSPENKRSAVAVDSPDRPGMVSIYVKGAPELLLKICAKAIGPENPIELGGDELLEIDSQITKMAQDALRVIGFAYIELSREQWEQNFVGDGSQVLSEIFDEKIRTNQPFFTWIGAIGLRDNLRPGVKESITYARDDCQLGVKLISGDHYETVKAVAKKCGIIQDKEDIKNTIMDGKEFEEFVGKPLYTIVDPSGGSIDTDQLENQENFRKIIGQLKVLARATPLHKEILVRGLKAEGLSVGVTGEGIDDVHCLASANVGLAMGSGCSVVKNKADLILTDDDFEANIKAIMWGRNIYYNVSRFLQYQMTVNVACLLTVIIGGIILTDSPFPATQLLWINLIMDTFAAIALSTEPPIKTVTTGPPPKSDQQIVTSAVKRQVIGVAVWHTIVMGVMFTSMVLSEEYDATVALDSTVAEEADKSLFKRQTLTNIFNTFMFLQIFNLINCRKVGSKDFNVFEDFHHNPFFLLVFVGTFLFQIWSNKNPIVSGILKVEHVQDKQQWGKAIAIGSTSLIAGAILKLVPLKVVEQYMGCLNYLNEDKAIKSKILDVYDQANSVKIKIPQDVMKKQDDNPDDGQKPPASADDAEFPTV